MSRDFEHSADGSFTCTTTGSSFNPFGNSEVAYDFCFSEEEVELEEGEGTLGFNHFLTLAEGKETSIKLKVSLVRHPEKGFHLSKDCLCSFCHNAKIQEKVKINTLFSNQYGKRLEDLEAVLFNTGKDEYTAKDSDLLNKHIQEVSKLLLDCGDNIKQSHWGSVVKSIEQRVIANMLKKSKPTHFHVSHFLGLPSQKDLTKY